ncbi:hypothetical protein LguiA_016751 [Lonicera macranthoides]
MVVKKDFAFVACVARDSLGRLLIIIFRVKSPPPQCSVMLAEALAIKEVCLFFIKSGITYAVIESDSAIVVSWCLKEAGSHLRIFMLLLLTFSPSHLGRNFSFSGSKDQLTD